MTSAQPQKWPSATLTGTDFGETLARGVRGVMCKRALSAVLLAVAGVAGGATAQDVRSHYYDVHGRLVGTAQTRAGAPHSFDSYVYDRAGNRTHRLVQVVAARAAHNELRSGETLVPQSSLVALDGRSQFVMQADGNVVLYVGSTPKWASGTSGTASLRLEMQTDGNLVLYDHATVALWYAITSTQGARLVLQNDCNAVLYSASGAGLWSTGTQC